MGELLGQYNSLASHCWQPVLSILMGSLIVRTLCNYVIKKDGRLDGDWLTTVVLSYTKSVDIIQTLFPCFWDMKGWILWFIEII